MNDPTPPAHDPYLEEMTRDNAQDDARAREMIAAVIDDTRTRHDLVARAAELASQRTERIAGVMQSGFGMTDREAAVYMLAGAPWDAPRADVESTLAHRMDLVARYTGGTVPAPEPAQPDPEPEPEPEPIPPAPEPAPVQQWLLPPMTSDAEFAKLRGFGGFAAWQGAPPADYLPSLRATGATHARVWYTARWDGARYTVSRDERDIMQAAVRQADSLGLYLVICVQIWGGAMPWGDAAMMASYVDVMADLAREHAGQTPIAGWDLTNEPGLHQLPDGRPATAEDYGLIVTGWRDLAGRCVDAMRAVADPWRLMVYQMGIGGDPSQFEQGEPLPQPGVICSVHYYHPHSWTHQHVADLAAGRPAAGPFVAMTQADVEAMDKVETTLDAWAERHPGRIVYMGESSAIRFAPGASDYVARVMRYCNRKGWPWSYHDWRGWWGWDAERTDPPPAPQQTGRVREIATMLPMRKVLAAPDAPVELAAPRSADAPTMQVLRAAMQWGRPQTPPDDLDAQQAPWYLGVMAPEFREHGWPLSLDDARRHWRQHGKPDGRKWAPDAPAPAWGPLWKDRPQGLT